MAGYTSRILFTLTVPSLFGFLSVLWFLKRKRNSSEKTFWNKGIQVEEVTDSTLDQTEQYPVLTSMKLKEQDSHSTDEHIQISSSDMQLKETPTAVEKQPQHTNGTSSSSPKAKGKKSKSKVRESRSTCSENRVTTNGCNKDKDSNVKEDIEKNLTNGMKTVSLNKEDSHQNGVATESKMSNGGLTTEKVKPTKLYSCHFKTQPTTSEVTTDCVQNNKPTATKENSVLEPAKEQCDNTLNCERNSQVTLQACASITEAQRPLTLPVDDCSVIGPSHEDMLESPGAKYCDSVGSNDSGKGGSEFQFILEQNVYYVVYEFEIIGDLCGLLIGRKGSHVKLIKEKTNANILIKRHPYFEELKICSISGAEEEIHAALKLIRNRFPIEKYPSVTLSQINTLPLEFQLPESLKLCLPEGVSFESMLCATVNAGHFFLQQPTHPTFHSLPALTSQMTTLYSQLDTPMLSHLDKGYVCVAGLTSGWFRAEVDEVLENSDECRLKFLDYGGYSVVPRSTLRQIRYDFMNVPFQATECYLGSVTFLEGETSWSAEATAAFEELAQGQIVQGYIVGYAENRVPYVHLHKITGATTEFINRELVSRGLARWVDSPQ